MNHLYFFIGTEAELIKLFPIIKRLEERKISYVLIASGQNNIADSKVLRAANGGRIDLQLSDEKDIKKSAAGLLSWYMQTSRKAVKMVKNAFPSTADDVSDIMIVHGDTVSTVMGAYLGKKLGMKVAHIEAGLRSHNWFNPFPEEIDRMLVSRKTDFHFAPGALPARNLKGKKNVFDTKYNTLIDSLDYAMKEPCTNNQILDLQNKDYFVFVMHRQENLSDDMFVRNILARIEHLIQKHICVMVLHTITRLKIENLGLMGRLKNDDRYVLLPRTDYFDFMKLLKHSQFVITDGGSNQEELSYMGKPALIIRKNTERNDGIGENAVLFGGKTEMIDLFAEHYRDFERKEISVEESPTEIVIEHII